MSQITFSLDGKDVTAQEGETIWQIAKREGVAIPHLCHKDAPGYRSDGNCRACMVDIEGERTLAASCIREPSEGMVVKTATERASKAREMVFELLAADQPSRDAHPDPESDFWKWSDTIGVTQSRFAPCEKPEQDVSHPAIAVNLDACIACNLCERACREVQVNDVIGNPNELQVVFDQNQGVSRCEQVFKAIEQVLYIQGMQASAWFIHHEQCAFPTAGREVSCQFESLTFSTGKGWEWLTQGDIPQSHIFELL
jgi:predicted molibdopterin-dependent oxidoreductase YjgC